MAYTKDKFFTDIKKMNKTNDKYEDKAYESIVENLFLLNKRGKWKAMGLDEYDSESNSKLTLIPGHIYMFKYITDTATKYNDGHIKFEYYDTLPLVLCTGNNKNIISGINLNLCSYELRTLILNDVYNLDPDFFNTKASEQAHQGQLPISQNISKFFINDNGQTKLLNYIKKKYNLQNTGFIFRTYNIKKIKDIRFIEPWQWQYIPFLKYKQSVKESILNMIQNITGISKIKI